MKSFQSTILVACAAIAGGCATVVPRELASAREAYRRASVGPAAQMTPAELHKAHEALAAAEQSFVNQPDSYLTRDLAYVAERKAQTAEALAAVSTYQANEAKSNSDFQATQTQLIGEAKRDLSQSRADLAASERSGDQTAGKLAAEQGARMDAERRATDAQAALAKLAAVKQEDRGMVITLSGSVLFASDKSDLLPASESRLGQVALALLETRERSVIVEGHTDSRGSDGHNLALSQRRADAVRNYLVQKGYEPDRVSARGIGMGRPVATNGSADGRANNRRVEIIVAPAARK